MSRQSVEQWHCHVCDRPVSRVLGLAGAVVLANRALSIRTATRGYCSRHRADVRDGWSRELESMGDVEWDSEPAVELRPRDVAEFLAYVDEHFAKWHTRRITSTGEAPCPHCGAAVEFGVGPHASDAPEREGSVAWLCRSCGAAGLAYNAD